MANEIRESRVIRIRDRIITPRDVYKLARVAFEEYKKRATLDENGRIDFTATCDDLSVFRSGDIALFGEDFILNSKRVLSVRIRYDSYKTDSHLNIEINHAGDDIFGDISDYGNKIEVEGPDSKWVNGTLKNLEEIVSGFTPQNTLLKRNRRLLQSLFAIGIGALITGILKIVLTALPTESNPDSTPSPLIVLLQNNAILGYIVVYAAYWIVGIFAAIPIVGKLLTLWPSVELQYGPEYKLIEKKRRIWMAGAFVIGIAPLLTSIVYDIFK